jgi:hypothetical protein
LVIKIVTFVGTVVVEVLVDVDVLVDVEVLVVVVGGSVVEVLVDVEVLVVVVVAGGHDVHATILVISGVIATGCDICIISVPYFNQKLPSVILLNVGDVNVVLSQNVAALPVTLTVPNGESHT